MNPILRNILAVVTGIIVGSFVNGGIIMISSSIIAPPEGADVTTTEGLKASMHLFEPKHFIISFMAHGLGTLVGALLAALIAASNKMRFALSIGICFLIGGIIMVFSLPSPLWFSITDLAGAYIPMAYLGARIVGVKK